MALEGHQKTGDMDRNWECGCECAATGVQRKKGRDRRGEERRGEKECEEMEERQGKIEMERERERERERESRREGSSCRRFGIHGFGIQDQVRGFRV